MLEGRHHFLRIALLSIVVPTVQHRSNTNSGQTARALHFPNHSPDKVLSTRDQGRKRAVVKCAVVWPARVVARHVKLAADEVVFVEGKELALDGERVFGAARTFLRYGNSQGGYEEEDGSLHDGRLLLPRWSCSVTIYIIRPSLVGNPVKRTVFIWFHIQARSVLIINTKVLHTFYHVQNLCYLLLY